MIMVGAVKLNEHKKIPLGIGPGGIKCICCVNSPGKVKDANRFYNRRFRRLSKLQLKQTLMEEEDGKHN